MEVTRVGVGGQRCICLDNDKGAPQNFPSSVTYLSPTRPDLGGLAKLKEKEPQTAQLRVSLLSVCR